MKLPNKYIYILKIAFIVVLSLGGVWLFMKALYFCSTLALAGIVGLAYSLYFDRKKLIERMEQMIAGIHHADFSSHFSNIDSNDEIYNLSNKMDEALEVFRNRMRDSMMDETETKAWQKLISVLTHEIMNSIAPILSLSETLSEREIRKNADTEEYRIMKQAMETIHRRSKGLLSFVENYRKLTRVPQPTLQTIDVDKLLKSLHQLVASENIHFSYTVYPVRLMLNADRSMVEQVLINLIKNAHEACVNQVKPQIEIKVAKIGPEVQITVSDNGTGISPEAIDKIFIPFYSTKQNGSGIGLSLCRQIMVRHEGKIGVHSDEKTTCFTLHFPSLISFKKE